MRFMIVVLEKPVCDAHSHPRADCTLLGDVGGGNPHTPSPSLTPGGGDHAVGGDRRNLWEKMRGECGNSAEITRSFFKAKNSDFFDSRGENKSRHRLVLKIFYLHSIRWQWRVKKLLTLKKLGEIEHRKNLMAQQMNRYFTFWGEIKIGQFKILWP